MLYYKAQIERDEVGYFGFLPNVQGVATNGATEEEVLENLKGAFMEALKGYIHNGKPIPLPKKNVGDAPHKISVPVSLALIIQMWNTMAIND